MNENTVGSLHTTQCPNCGEGALWVVSISVNFCLIPRLAINVTCVVRISLNQVVISSAEFTESRLYI